MSSSIYLDNRYHRRPADKQRSVTWAQSLLHDTEWVILDTESTGIEETAEIVQIALISSSGELLLDSLVKPAFRKNIPAEATAKHGISIESLAGAPSMPEILPKLNSLTRGKLIVAYNAEFRKRIIEQTIRKNCASDAKFRGKWHCAMFEYARYVGEWWPSKNDYKYQKLPGAEHSAYGDCRATLALIKHMAACNDFDGLGANDADYSGTVDANMPHFELEGAGLTGTLPIRYGSSPTSGAWFWRAAGIFVLFMVLMSVAVSSTDHSTGTLQTTASDYEAAATERSVPKQALDRLPGSVHSWNPIVKFDDIRATLVTTVRDDRTIDYSFYLSGAPGPIEQLAQSNLNATIELVNFGGTSLSSIAVPVHQMSRDDQNNLVMKGSLSIDGNTYGQVHDWHLELPGLDTVLSTSAVPTTISDEMPPIAPDRPQQPRSVPAPTEVPEQTADGQSEQQYNQNSGAASSSTDAITPLEQQIFGAPAPRGTTASERLTRLELAVFKTASPERSIDERLRVLQQTINGDQR